MHMFPVTTLDVTSVLHHVTITRTPSYMRKLRDDCDEDPTERNAVILEQYNSLKDGEFPTDLTNPKWFSLPPHYYCKGVKLNYTPLRKLVLADLRSISDKCGTSKHPTLGKFRSRMDDAKMCIAHALFPADSWPYGYYAADEYHMYEVDDLFEVPDNVDGWMAYDAGDDEWTEVAIARPFKVISPEYKIVG